MGGKFWGFILLFFFSFSLYAQEESLEKKDVFITADFFDKEEILEFDLAFDIRTYSKEKSDSIYLPAVLSFYNQDSIKVSKDVKLRSRGIYRNNLCSFPPIMLNLKKANIREGVYEGEKKYKIVTHCKTTKVFERYIHSEYITYKLWSIISDYSFKVRLAKINYINTLAKNDTSTQWAFILEPEDALAERLDMYPLKRDNMRYSQADTLQTTIMSIFQFMIGNTDYSIGGRHNVKLLVSKDHTKPGFIPVPYDFDFSGMVNTYYARPNPDLPIKSVTHRIYYGMCRSDEVYNEVLALFLEKKEQMYNYVLTAEYLNKKTRKYIVSYLDEFYKLIGKKRFVELYIRTTCDH